MIKIIKLFGLLIAFGYLQNINAIADSKTFVVAQRTFQVPETWKAEQPSSKMRKAQYKFGKTEIVVFYFGAGSGGSATSTAMSNSSTYLAVGPFRSGTLQAAWSSTPTRRSNAL